MSYDVFPLKDWGAVDTTPDLWGQSKKTQNRAWRDIFKKTPKNQKLAYYRNYCVDSIKFHKDTDHQMLFARGLKPCITNPRWRTAAILKIENRH